MESRTLESHMQIASAALPLPAQVRLPQAPIPDPVATPVTASDMLAQAEARPDAQVDKVLMAAGLGGGLANLAGVGTGASIMAHEVGHAVAAEALFQGANPQITIHPFKGGVTSYHAGALTPLGQQYGRDGSLAITAAAGPLVDTAISVVTFAAGFAMRKKHPIAGGTLMGYAGMTMLNDTLYAGSALFGSTVALAKTGNDFANLAVHAGIPPMVSVALMAAILPAEYLLLKGAEKLAEKVQGQG